MVWHTNEKEVRAADEKLVATAESEPLAQLIATLPELLQVVNQILISPAGRCRVCKRSKRLGHAEDCRAYSPLLRIQQALSER